MLDSPLQENCFLVLAKIGDGQSNISSVSFSNGFASSSHGTPLITNCIFVSCNALILPVKAYILCFIQICCYVNVMPISCKPRMPCTVISYGGGLNICIT